MTTKTSPRGKIPSYIVTTRTTGATDTTVVPRVGLRSSDGRGSRDSPGFQVWPRRSQLRLPGKTLMTERTTHWVRVIVGTSTMLTNLRDEPPTSSVEGRVTHLSGPDLGSRDTVSLCVCHLHLRTEDETHFLPVILWQTTKTTDFC